MARDHQERRAVSRERYDRLEVWSNRRPCVALMGEFSAGKSTLLNFLIEGEVLPTRATATELPPIWFSQGEDGSHWVDADGTQHPMEPAEIGAVPMHARYVRIYSKAEILEHCDIVDTPGISDPNLAAESWRFAVGVANMVLWCTSATQAWRETERSAWTSLPERLRKHSLLIVTRSDKLLTEADRQKVDRRLARETADLFHARVFMSTPDAVQAKADLAEDELSPKWEASGAGRLLDLLAERFEAIYEDRKDLLDRYTAEGIEVRPRQVRPSAGEVEAVDASSNDDPGREGAAEPGMSAQDEATPGRLMPTRPQRVQAGAQRRVERPSGEDIADYVAQVRGVMPEPGDEDGTMDIAAEAGADDEAGIAEATAAAQDEEDQVDRAALAEDSIGERPDASPPAAETDDHDADAAKSSADASDPADLGGLDAPSAEHDAGDEIEPMAEANGATAGTPDAADIKSAKHAVDDAELPRELRIWREIVARTAVSEANEQIVGMIDELLAQIVRTDAGSATPDATEPDPDEADESAASALRSDASPASTWRRLA